ncbi:MAG TPA: NAD-dependent epimerase/dehydratase family protein [Armatimonadota bacterium]|jgi:UDP-glucose 4-epimerase
MLEAVLVTGAHGFLGRHVARLFALQGHAVAGIGHGEWPPEEWSRWGLSEWHTSAVTIDALRQHAGAPSVIVHCAGSGSVPLSLVSPWEDFQRTVATTADVLEYVRVYSPATRVVYPSSASVYGVAKTFPIGEGSRLAPISPYGVHKLMAEQLVQSYGRQFQLPGAIVRFFSVYGCGLEKQLLWDACRKLAAGDCVFMGTGDEVRDWLYVGDAATLLLAAAANAAPRCPIANGGTGEGVSVRELLLQVSHSLNPNSSEPEFSGASRTGDPSRYIADISKATDWGWKPEKHWRDGVAEYVAWWQRHGVARTEA